MSVALLTSLKESLLGLGTKLAPPVLLRCCYFLLKLSASSILFLFIIFSLFSDVGYSSFDVETACFSVPFCSLSESFSPLGICLLFFSFYVNSLCRSISEMMLFAMWDFEDCF